LKLIQILASKKQINESCAKFPVHKNSPKITPMNKLLIPAKHDVQNGDFASDLL
jgi:hypothetical protein